MAEKLSIARAAEMETLGVFRDWIDDICKRAGIDEDTCYELKLAVDEATANVIVHGYAGMNPGTVILDLQIEPGQVIMTLTDYGHCFEPSEPTRPEPESLLGDRPPGGFGLLLIYQTMDHVDYQVTEDGNRLILIKKLPPRTGARHER